MNRKLLNGFLLLAVAVGGVGTFTSCKDEDLRNDIIVGQISLQDQIDAIRNFSDTQFTANLLNWLKQNYQYSDIPGTPHIPDDADFLTWLNALTVANADGQFEDYPDFVQKAALMYEAYDNIKSGKIGPNEAALIEGIYNYIEENLIPESQWFKDFQNDILGLQQANAAMTDFLETLTNAIQNNLSQQVSSIVVNQTINPIFGTINLPVGLNSTILASYLYQGVDAEFSFPSQVLGHLSESGQLSNLEEARATLAAVQSLSAGISEKLVNGSYTVVAEGDGNMGNAYLTINPTDVDFTNLKLEVVNSKGEVVLSSEDLAVEATDDDLYFGITRADNSGTGLYKVQANAPADYSGVKFNFSEKSDLKAAIKDLIKDKTLSDVAQLGEVIYKSMNNVLPAYAFRVTYDEETVEYTVDDNGNVKAVVTTTPKMILSKFDVAATVVHPLSYSEPIADVLGSVTGKRLPLISPLSEYLDRLSNKLVLNLGQINGVDDVELNMHVEVVDGNVVFTYTSTDGTEVTECIPYDFAGLAPFEGQIENFVNAVLEAANYQLAGDLNYKLVKQLNDAIADINKQLDNLQAKVGSFQNYIDDIKKSNKLNYAQKLVDVYNQVAKRVNNFLANPNHYLQVMMAYNAGDGVHHLSTDPNCPVTARTANGDGLELYASSYTGDVVVPSYKKYVAITAVDGAQASKEVNAQAGLNKVFPGNQQRIAVNVKGLEGKTLTLTYISVDYRGVCSMQNYYVRVL